MFGKYGLVILEPDNTELKKIFSPVIIGELVNGSTYKIVTGTDLQLAETGIEPKVHPREINLFYIDENGRNRIVRADPRVGPYEITGSGKTFTENEILNEVKTSPEKFSPNVLLRPVYQQSILPNVAYIGGPAEIAYWLQLKSTFEYYKIPFPVLMPRNSALIINTPVPHKMAKLNLELKDLFNGYRKPLLRNCLNV